MKKTLIALASVAALGAAHADVTLYGVIDAAFGSTSSGLSSDGNNPSNANVFASNGQPIQSAVDQKQAIGRTTSMANGLLQPSRWGIKGSEDMGGGLKANFVLESGLNIANGSNPNDHALLSSVTSTGGVTGAGDSSLNGQMFDRQASVGLSGDFGAVDVGFQLNLNGELNGLNDPLGGGYISPLGTYGGLTGMGSSYSGRQSNSIKYAYSVGTTTIKAFYAMGGYSGNMGQGAQFGLASIMQVTPDLQIDIGASAMKDNVSYGSALSGSLNTTQVGNGSTAGASTSPYTPCAAAGNANLGACVQNPIAGLSATYYNSSEVIVGANWQASAAVKVNVGYIQVVQSNASNGAADYLITQNLGVPIVQSSVNTSPYASNKTTSAYWIGGTYNISNTDRVKVAYYGYQRSAYTAGSDAKTVGGTPGVSPATASVSAQYAQSQAPMFGFVYDHDLSKKTDVYLAANYQKFDNGNQWATVYSDGTQKSQSAGGNGLMGQSISFIGAGLRVKF